MHILPAYLLKGRIQAISVTSALVLFSLLFPLLSIVSSAAIALVTLRQGGLQGGIVLLGSSVLAMLMRVLLLGDFEPVLHYTLILLVPIWIVSIVLREWQSLNLALQSSVLLGVLSIIVFYILLIHPAEFWSSKVNVPQVVELVNQMPDAQISAEVVKKFAGIIVHFMTGLTVFTCEYAIILGLFLGRWWQDKLFNPGGFRQEFLGLKGAPKFAIFTLIVFGCTLLPFDWLAELSVNILMVLFVFYTILGVAILHCLLAARKSTTFLVPFFYACLMIFSLFIPYIMLLIAVCGLSDTWLNLRNKLKPNGMHNP